MDIDEILNAFEKILGKYPDWPVGEIRELLCQNLPKFDIQDEAIIEALLRDKDNILDKSFTENIENYLENTVLEGNRRDFLKSEEGKRKIVEIFVSVLQNLIDYFYHVIITKQFGG
ncbi:MAG: hypothetical protein C4291_10635 [Candidatus Dadabacteria bacterium]